MLRVQQAGHWRPADGAPLERGVMPQPTPPRKVHFPGYAHRAELRQSRFTVAANAQTAALLKPDVRQRAPRRPAQRTGLPPTRKPRHRPTRYSDRRATLPHIRQHSPNAAGPKNMMDSPPKAHCTLRTARPKALPGPEATSPTALLRQTSESTLSWLLRMFMGRSVVGPLF
jgi:hypothetical protein